MRHPIKRKSLRQLVLPPALEPLKQFPNWVVWRRNRGGAKLPFTVDGELADVSDPESWSQYSHVRRVSKNIGFVLLGTNIGALDLDDCRDPVTGRLDEWANELIERCRSYTEVTPSRCGVRIIGLSEGPAVHTHRRIGKGKVEVYRNTARYITVTGRQLGRCDRLRDISHVIRELAPQRAALGQQRVHIDECDDDWRTIVRRRGASVSSMVRANVAQGKRSEVIWSILQKLKARGATPGELLTVLLATRCFIDKWGEGNERAARKEVERVFSK